MSGKTGKRKKHVPQRTCVGCRDVQAKQTLVRIVRTPEDGVQVDPQGKMHGRGAYLHNRRSCWEDAFKGKLANALKTELSETDLERLRDYMEGLPEEDQAVQ